MEHPADIAGGAGVIEFADAVAYDIGSVDAIDTILLCFPVVVPLEEVEFLSCRGPLRR